jgi:hypothetical protein
VSRGKALTVRQEDIMRLEGVAQKLSDLEPAFRPKAEAVDYIAQQLGVRRRVVQDWLRLARPSTHRSDTAAAFMDVASLIGKLLSEHTYAQVFAMARAGERDGFRAAQWLLPRIDPDRFDPSVSTHEANEDDVFSTAGIPQEVFDALTDEQREEIAELRSAMFAAMERYETIIKEAQSSVLAQELAQRQHGSP